MYRQRRSSRAGTRPIGGMRERRSTGKHRVNDVNEDNYKIELFVFPDGTSVEMIVFDDGRRRVAPSAARGVTAPGTRARGETPLLPSRPCSVPPPPSRDQETDARACPVCGGALVYPVAWERCGPAEWNIELRCPDCELRREVVLGRAAVEQFNRDLYLGAQALAREVERMVRRNFEEEAERIVAALERDLIQPMDF